jgi:subtilisin-like proprotein convertase family protein
MKASTLLSAAVILAAACSAQATMYTQVYSTGTLNPVAAIPDGDPAGMTQSVGVNGVSDIGSFLDVTVSLNIAGGYNGSLYGYLAYTPAGGGDSTAMAVLLNRPGLGSGGIVQQNFGFSTSGMNVTLDDSITQPSGNINTTQSPANGGTYNSAGTALATAFTGESADGTWTLFLADEVAGGGTPVLDSWSLTISESPVPEPVTVAGIIFGSLFLTVGAVKRIRPSKQTA